MTSTSKATPRIYIVDDEESIQKLVQYNFERAGFVTEVTADGEAAYARIQAEPDRFDLVVLDVMLPGTDGLEVCRRLRLKGIRVPIILLTALDEEVDRIVGLELGADDYVTKPFSPRELVARAKAVLRRMEAVAPRTDESASKKLSAGSIRLDADRHECEVAGNLLNLTPKEFDLLQYFMEHPDRVLSREMLLDQVWGYLTLTDTRIVDVHVSHLREKIETDGKNPQYIRTIRGIGYKFTAPGPSERRV